MQGKQALARLARDRRQDKKVASPFAPSCCSFKHHKHLLSTRGAYGA
jgi:hypothetical protein